MGKTLFTVQGLSGREACRIGFFAATPFLFAVQAHAQGPLIDQLADMSLEDLASIRVTSVSKKAEPIADAAASVFVITSEDIRHSGATTLPEVLRLAPNLQIAQGSGTDYAISARGFNGSNNSAPNKLLVLIDGRSVYSPLFSGVFWELQDLMLEDVERIEVISGPGGTLWGVNAVNGVINVITRPAKETQGRLAVAGLGDRGSDVAFRQGGKLGEDGSYRVYGKYLDRDNTEKGDGSDVNDSWHKSQLGFRADWARSGDEFTLNGSVYDAEEEQPEPGAISVSGTNLSLGPVSAIGANLTARWGRRFGDGSSMSVQAYYDRTERSIRPTFSEKLDIIDLQFERSLAPSERHALTWGANYRYSMDRVNNKTNVFAFLPADVNQRWLSLFAQDDITLRDDLRLTLGARIERNDYTGNEVLPNARLAWKPAPDHLLWAAVSRAVRAPSRLDVDAYIPATPPFLLNGGRGATSEIAKVFELGYRGQPGPWLSYSVTAFHADYDDLRTQEIVFGPGAPFVVFANGMEGRASGVEMWGKYQVSPHWRLSAGYTALREKFRLKPGSNDFASLNTVGNDPKYTLQLRSTLNIAPDKELDVAARHVNRLENTAVPSYTAIDARFGWRLRPGLELSVIGQNLNGSHAEYGPAATRSEIPRSVFVKLVWRD